MATSGTTDFNLQIDDLIEEAFERCGMRMTAGYQLSSARRSLNLLFLDWANRGLNLWTIEEATFPLVKGSRVLDLDQPAKGLSVPGCRQAIHLCVLPDPTHSGCRRVRQHLGRQLQVPALLGFWVGLHAFAEVHARKNGRAEADV
jgi:hypothetical protein